MEGLKYQVLRNFLFRRRRVTCKEKFINFPQFILFSFFLQTFQSDITELVLHNWYLKDGNLELNINGRILNQCLYRGKGKSNKKLHLHVYVYLISKAQVQLYQYILSSEEERAQEEYLVAGPCWEEDSVLTYSGVGRVLQTDSQSGQLSSNRKPFLSNMGMGLIQWECYEYLNWTRWTFKKKINIEKIL